MWSARVRRVFIRASWVPPALWAATLLYLRPYDGWGAWAAAPLLLPSLVLSLIWVVVGVVLLAETAVRERRADFPVLAATLSGGAAGLYYTLRHLLRSWGVVLLLGSALAAPLHAQVPAQPPRRLSAAETGCDSTRAAPTDSVYEADGVDQPAEARRLPIEGMPIRIREMLTGRSVFRFVVEPSGRIDGCSIALVRETSRAWTESVLRELRVARRLQQPR